jgi:hypothetical protein
MRRLNIEIENCYGIGKLNQNFEFIDENGNINRTKLIYARNGVMKSSFAKVFKDISNNLKSMDRVDPTLESVRNILIDGEEIDPSSILVTESLSEKIELVDLNTLLVSEDIRKQYTSLTYDINESIKYILDETKKTINLPDLQSEFKKIFNCENMIDIFKKNIQLIRDSGKFKLDPNNYSLFFSKEVTDFMENSEVKTMLEEYLMKYQDLLSNALILSETFTNYDAENIRTNLEKYGFFEAGHSVNLLKNPPTSECENLEEPGDDIILIRSIAEFETQIEHEKKRIFDNEEMKKIFNKIDSKLNKNLNLRKFREIIKSDKQLILEFKDVNTFKKKLIAIVFSNYVDKISNLIIQFEKNEIEIKRLIKLANSEKNSWDEVIEKFHERFDVPFKLIVENREDTILGGVKPNIKFMFSDGRVAKQFDDADKLAEVLSTGQKRSLYLLNILFEIEKRKKMTRQGHKFLFVFDDVVDSFDYQNKYGIVEYLKEVSEYDNIYSIFLTHNFDFYRTFAKRALKPTQQNFSFLAIKFDDEISIEEFKYLDPFTEWKKTIPEFNDSLEYSAALIAYAPFIRELTHYLNNVYDKEDTSYFNKILHHKSDSSEILVRDYINHCERLIKFTNIKESPIYKNEIRMQDFIFGVASKVVEQTKSQSSERINLEFKVTLSIAIRLKAEIYIKNILNSNSIKYRNNNDQIGYLYGILKKKMPLDSNIMQLLERIVIMTPENIHLNSFVFEPLFDVSNKKMTEMYDKLMELFH